MILNANFGLELGRNPKKRREGFIMNMMFASSVKMGGRFDLVGVQGVGLFNILGTKDGSDYKLIGYGKQN